MPLRPDPVNARVAVIGGGISGLAAAYFLRRDAEVVLFEATERLGGKIRTERFGDAALDVGPDGFLFRKLEATTLCAELGLADDLAASAGAPPLVWTARGLRPLPAGLVLGVPARPFAGAALLSPAGALRALGDLVLPARRADADESVGALVGRRFGGEVVERLVEPLVGAVYGGRARVLSARATTPWLVDAERRYRSVILGMRALASNGAGGATFLTLRGGLTRLVDALRGSLADVRVGAPVRTIQREADGFRLDVCGERFDAVIVATPAPEAAALLEREAPDVARELRAIAYASVTIVALRYPAGALPRAPAQTGFVVPPDTGRLLTACTWSSVKWPHLATADGSLLARCAVDERAQGLDDGALIGRVDAELRLAAGITAGPTATRVARWDRALPRYEVGHLDRVAGIARGLAAAPGLILTGAAYGGVGLPDCVRQAREAAATARFALGRAA